MIKAILFDMDGVLIDSHDAWFDIFNATLKNFGFDTILVSKFDEDVWGINFAKTAAKYFPGKRIEEIREYFYKIFDKFIAKVKKIKNVDKTLKYLKNKNLKLVVVSNGQSNLVKKLLEKIDIKKYFNLIIGGERVKDGKPNPEIILIACNELKLKPSETILVGDTIYDKQAAEAAGCGFIGYKLGDIKDLIEIKKRV